MTVQTLTQNELDDAYHMAVFDCDQALADIIRQMFFHRQEQMSLKGISPSLWNAIRDDLHNVLSAAFNDCEVKHMGGARYDALMDRITARSFEEKANQ